MITLEWQFGELVEFLEVKNLRYEVHSKITVIGEGSKPDADTGCIVEDIREQVYLLHFFVFIVLADREEINIKDSILFVPSKMLQCLFQTGEY